MFNRIKNSFNQKAIIADLTGAIGGAVYAIIPSLLGLNGYTGLASGVVASWLLGAISNQPGIRAGGMGAAAAHLSWSYDISNKFFGKVQWRLDETAQVFKRREDGTAVQISDNGTQVIDVGGEKVIASTNPALSGTIYAGGRQVSDSMYMGGRQLSDDSYYDGSSLMDNLSDMELYKHAS